MRCVRRSGRARGFWSVVELRERICGAVVVKVSSGWIRSAIERVRGLRERREARLAGVVIPAFADGTFSRARGFPSRVRQVLRDSTIDALVGSRGRALRFFRGSGALAVSCGFSRTFVRTLDRIFSRKISPEGRKNAGSQPSHLMHSVSRVYILSHS